MGYYLRSGLEAMVGFATERVQGIGLMQSLRLPDGREGYATACRLAERGLLCGYSQDYLLLMPPLLTTKAEIDKGLSILTNTLVEGV